MAQERSQQELHAAMKRCFAVVNSSISEGMSAAILEVNIFRAQRTVVAVKHCYLYVALVLCFCANVPIKNLIDQQTTLCSETKPKVSTA